MTDSIRDYLDSITQEAKRRTERTESERLLRDFFRKGIDADILRKVFARFLSPEEIERIITDEMSKMSNQDEPLCTREEALQVALRKVNQGCCVQYVSNGLKEWLGIEIRPDELDAELSEQPGLLSSYQRLRNTWYNIRYMEPESINPIQIQEKYGFNWKYQECILEPCENNNQGAELAQTDKAQVLSEKIIEQIEGPMIRWPPQAKRGRSDPTSLQCLFFILSAVDIVSSTQLHIQVPMRPVIPHKWLLPIYHLTDEPCSILVALMLYHIDLTAYYSDIDF